VKSTTLSWLLHDPLAYTIPSIKSIDKIMNFFSRSGYLTVRHILRLILGRKKRDKLKFYNKLHSRTNITFSFYCFIIFFKITTFLKLGKPSLIKIIVPKYGYKVFCPPTEQDYFLMTEREDEILEYFCPNKNDIVIDIGAYLGRYTFICSNKVGNNGKVISIEANPVVFEKLNKSIQLNNSHNIIPLNCAVFSKETQIQLFLRENSKNKVYSPHNTIMLGRDKLTYDRSKKENFVIIKANILDTIVPSIGIKHEHIKWIKIDVEGAELEVLKGAHKILSQSKDITILIEVHHLDENKNLFELIMNLLNNYNFKIIFQKIHDGGERHIVVRKKQF
jgi:FkbM family methyltransferase